MWRLLRCCLQSAAVPGCWARLLDLDWSACRTHVGICKSWCCQHVKTDVQHRQSSTCSSPGWCQAEPVGPANIPETGQIRRHTTCSCCSDRLGPGKQRQTVKGLWTLDSSSSNSLVVKHQTANLGTQVRFLGCCTPTQGINWEAGGVGMPNANMCSERPLVRTSGIPSDKLLLTRLDSDFDQTPKDLLT